MAGVLEGLAEDKIENNRIIRGEEDGWSGIKNYSSGETCSSHPLVYSIFEKLHTLYTSFSEKKFIKFYDGPRIAEIM